MNARINKNSGAILKPGTAVGNHLISFHKGEERVKYSITPQKSRANILIAENGLIQLDICRLAANTCLDYELA